MNGNPFTHPTRTLSNNNNVHCNFSETVKSCYENSAVANNANKIGRATYETLQVHFTTNI